MLKLTRTLPALFLPALFLLAPGYFTPLVKAETLVITQGSLINAHLGPTYSFSGENFNLTGGGLGGFGLSIPCDYCSPRQSPFHLSAIFGTEEIYDGSGMINGVNYPQFFTGGEFVFTTAGTVTIPDIIVPEITLTTPFTFSGRLCARTAHNVLFFGCQPSDPDYLFSTQLSGQGLATLRLYLMEVNVHGPLYLATSVTYDFSPAPSSVPEPATIILLGTGLASLAARARRRRQADPGGE